MGISLSSVDEDFYHHSSVQCMHQFTNYGFNFALKWSWSALIISMCVGPQIVS